MVKGNDILMPKKVCDNLRIAHLMPPQQESSVLTVACRPDDFSASVLARAVEDSDAHLINLNVTATRLDDGRITVELRTNHSHYDSTARSLERYGFEVIAADASAAGNADDVFSRRAAELLHIINI